MIVTAVVSQKNRSKPPAGPDPVELYVIGNCLSIETREGQITRVKLTKAQWRMLSNSALKRTSPKWPVPDEVVTGNPVV